MDSRFVLAGGDLLDDVGGKDGGEDFDSGSHHSDGVGEICFGGSIF